MPSNLGKGPPAKKLGISALYFVATASRTHASEPAQTIPNALLGHIQSNVEQYQSLQE